MKASPSFLALAVICGFSFAACGGGTGTSEPLVCPAAALPAPPPMIYPQNGATGVPDGNFPLVLAWSYGAAISLQTASGGAVTGALASTSLPNPLPSPAATPVPGASPAAYSVPQLKAGTTYSVVATFAQGQCPSSSESSGSFTTR